MAAVETATAVGSLLNGTYRLERVIAEGGMGIVYEASHVRLPRRFAVKVLGKPGDPRIAPTALHRFQREAEIASTLAHPHIVEVFDFQVSEQGAPYLVMEMLEGEDLADRLKRKGRLPIVAALRVIQEVATALDLAHERGVVHRDLKPANIFLSHRAGREDFVKVLDFGVSKLIDAATLTHEKAMVGTPLYMSPEQAVGTQELTPASDVFSLGSIAFEMLTGRRAFAASSIPSILYQIVHGPTPSLQGRAPGVPIAADAVFARVLAKRREERFPTATQFALALGRAFDRATPGEALPIDDEKVPEVPHDARRSSTNEGDTEIDPSTQAEEAMEAAAGPPPNASFTGALKPRRRPWLVLMGLLAFVLGAAGMVMLTRPPQVAALVASTVESGPSVEAKAPPVVVIPPAPVEKPAAHPADVKFTFNVSPKSAQIFIDGRRVKRALKLPWQEAPRRVKVSAPGYVPIQLSAPSTESRVFELHMERLAPKKKVAPPPAPPHGAAPVQDL